MLSSLFPGNDSVAAVRRPRFEISFGGGAGGGGLLSAASSLLAGGGADPWQQHLVSLTIEVGLAPAVDVAKVALAAGAEAPQVAVGDAGSISLGYEDGSTELVFTGQVEAVRHSLIGTTRLTAVNGGAALAKLRINQSYEQQAAGQIVSDLASTAGVDTDAVEDGPDLPFYLIHDGQSAYQHVAALARKSGYLAYLTPAGELCFAPFSGGEAVQTFGYGQDILALQITDAAPVVAATRVVGEGAAGSQGQEAWSWLVKDPAAVTAEGGEDGPQRDIADPSLRSGEAAQGAAGGIAYLAGLQKLSGWLRVPGAPAVSVGSAIEINGAPQEALNGLCLVRWLRHQYDKYTGFTTTIHFSQAGEGGFSLPGGLGGLF